MKYMPSREIEMFKKMPAILIICLLCWINYLSGQAPELTESERLAIMFNEVKDGIVFCYSDGSKTTGIFVSKDGWILTAGHKVDKDFPAAHRIHVKLTRGDDGEVFQSVKIISPPPDWDLLLFKIDYKPKFYFKRFKKPYLFQENWIFGFRISSGKVPSSAGYITHNTQLPKLLLTTAPVIGGNSGSPVLDRKGNVLGVLTRGYAFGDGFFIPSVVVKEYIKVNLK